MLDLVLEELDQVVRDLPGALVSLGVGGGLIGVVGLDNTNNLLSVNGDRCGSNAVFNTHNEVRLALGRQIGHGNIVEAIEAGQGGVDLNDNLGGTSQYN